MPDHTALPDGVDLDALTRLRRLLHREPELSGDEETTRDRIGAFLQGTSPDGLVTGIGGHGVAAVFDGGAPGPWILLRSDMDAVAVAETGDRAYASRHPGVSHACGHDGHAAILAGVAQVLAARRPRSGKAILLFQPAEETGEGAAAVLADPRFGAMRPHHVFALHNLPGYPLGHMVCRPGTFAAASAGLRIRLKGKTAHAAEPENGLNPAPAVAAVIQGLTALPTEADLVHAFSTVSIVHVRLGQPSFGGAAGDAEICATLRAFDDAVMDRLLATADTMVKQTGEKTGLGVHISTHEVFPAAVNDPQVVADLRQVLQAAGLTWIEPDTPFRFSEDMAHLLGYCPGALLGIGAGMDCPGLHQSGYDFPDGLIAHGIGVFASIIDHWLNKSSAPLRVEGSLS